MLWRNRDFLKLWTGQTVSLFGTLLGALPFTAVFLLHASAMQMAVLSACQMLPGFLSGPLAGVWADRLRRRPIMIAADLGRAALLASVFAAAAFDQLRVEQLYAVAFAMGVMTIFFDVAYHAYLPAIVPEQHLLEGNARLAASASVAEAGSFSAGGFIVQLASTQVAVLADSVSFVVSAASLAAIRSREPAPVPAASREGVLREMREGLRTLLADPVLRALGLATVARHFSYGAIGAVILLFATTGELGFEPGVVGLIFAVGGVSSLAGATLAGRVTRWLGAGPAMIGGLLLAAFAAMCLPLAPGATVAGAAFLIAQQLFGDAGDTVFSINEASLRQAIVAPRMLGRIQANIRFASLGMMLAGALFAGVIGQQAGLRAALFAGAAGSFAAAALLLASPLRRMRVLPIRTAAAG